VILLDQNKGREVGAVLPASGDGTARIFLKCSDRDVGWTGGVQLQVAIR